MGDTHGIDVTIVATVKHADLRKAVKKLGSQSAVARLLGVHVTEFGRWCNLKESPPVDEDEISRRPAWTPERVATLEKQLFDLTGKLLSELFPVELRRNKKWLEAAKTVEVDQHITTAAMLQYAGECANRLTFDLNRETNAAELKELTANALKRLSGRQQLVLKLRFWEGYTYEECGHILRLTRERVRQIEAKALRRLQLDSNINRSLVDFIGPPPGDLPQPSVERTLREIYAQDHVSES